MPLNIPYGGGGGGTPQLAPDLNYITNKFASNALYYRVTGIDGSAGFATALSLTGKYVINLLKFTSVTNENVTVKLTVDNDVIWNSSVVVAGGEIKLISDQVSGFVTSEAIACNTSLLLEIQTTTDTSVTLDYIARPIK